MTGSSAYGKFHVYIPNQRERRRGKDKKRRCYLTILRKGSILITGWGS
jgi:hypothetical protein